MSEENKDHEYNDEIANKLIKLNQRAKDELIAREFILEKTKDKSYKEKPPMNYKPWIIVVLGIIAISVLVYFLLIKDGSNANHEVTKNPMAIFILNNSYYDDHLEDLLHHDVESIWTSEGKGGSSKDLKEIKVPGNYKKLKDFFDYCRISGISNIHLLGDLGQQQEKDIDMNNLDQYVIIDKAFWEFFKNSEKPILMIHDKGQSSNIKDRILKRRDEVLNEK